MPREAPFLFGRIESYGDEYSVDRHPLAITDIGLCDAVNPIERENIKRSRRFGWKATQSGAEPRRSKRPAQPKPADELRRTVRIMAYSFGEVRNSDLQAQRDEQPWVIGEHLSQLTSAGWLIKPGHGKGTRYSWPDTPQDLLTGTSTPTSPVTGGEVTGEVTGEVKKLLQVLKGEMSRSELQESLGLMHEDHFRSAYLRPGLNAGLITMTIPDKPRSRLQKYCLTAQGHAVLSTTKKSDE